MAENKRVCRFWTMDGAHEAFVGEELKGLGICGKVVPRLFRKLLLVGSILFSMTYNSI